MSPIPTLNFLTTEIKKHLCFNYCLKTVKIPDDSNLILPVKYYKHEKCIEKCFRNDKVSPT